MQSAEDGPGPADARARFDDEDLEKQLELANKKVEALEAEKRLDEAPKIKASMSRAGDEEEGGVIQSD